MARRFLVILLLVISLPADLLFAQSSGGSTSPANLPSASPPPGAQQPANPAPAKPKNGTGQIYSLGDQMFVMNAGLFIPLFFQQAGVGVSGTNLSLGGTGSLEWSSYLNNNLSLGIELGGAFAFSPNGNTMFMIPITGTVTWTFRSYPFEFPIFVGAGVDFLSVTDQLFFGPILKPGVGAYWYFTPKWEIGLRAVYWWVPEIYLGDNPPPSHSRFGNFLGISLSAIYHF